MTSQWSGTATITWSLFGSGFQLEVVRSRQGAMARSVEVPWEQLTPGSPSDAGRGRAPLDVPPVPGPASLPLRRKVEETEP